MWNDVVSNYLVSEFACILDKLKMPSGNPDTSVLFFDKYKNSNNRKQTQNNQISAIYTSEEDTDSADKEFCSDDDCIENHMFDEYNSTFDDDYKWTDNTTEFCNYSKSYGVFRKFFEQQDVFQKLVKIRNKLRLTLRKHTVEYKKVKFEEAKKVARSRDHGNNPTKIDTRKLVGTFD